MAKKINGRGHKESGYQNRKPEVLPDEITLRDEILSLKRQLMILKRTNEHYSVRLRKYEDEAKRKDKQLEELMNPRKNADVTKILSSKGAAILMNLKDQNNALVQMVLNKDLHIRRLVAEVKMSKLYASTKRNESYKAEISRLRNLLLKSEETLRENAELQQEQTRSICVGGNPILEFSSSSDQSSPRDLDELRSTISKLEAHIKYSNDLLAQKNHEISLLSDELNLLRKYLRYKASKAGVYDYDLTSHKLSTTTFTRSWPDPLNSKNLSNQDLLDFFEKQPNTGCDQLSRSAPAGLTKFESDSTPEHTLTITGNGSEINTEASFVNAADCEHTKTSVVKSLYHNLAASEILKETTLIKGKKPQQTTNKWKEAFIKFRELKKLKVLDIDHQKLFLRNEISCRKSEVGADAPSVEKGCKTVDELKLEISQPPTNYDNNSNQFNASESCQTTQNCSPKSNNSDKCSDPKNADKHSNHLKFNANDSELELENSKNDFVETKERKSLREVYCQSLDSSFDSESGYNINEQIRQVQVEVQINSVSVNNEKSETSASESSQTYESDKETDRNYISDIEFNDDDDDVVVR